MSKEASKKMFEWYAQVADDRLKEKYSHIETFKDCEDESELKNWLLLVYIKHYGLRCTCDDCMDWEFHIASSHYHDCQLYKFCHAVNRCLDWAEQKSRTHKVKPCQDGEFKGIKCLESEEEYGFFRNQHDVRPSSCIWIKKVYAEKLLEIFKNNTLKSVVSQKKKSQEGKQDGKICSFRY
jgi:hypothetical protein